MVSKVLYFWPTGTSNDVCILIFLQLNGSLRHICSFKANINALLATLRNFFIENLQNFVLELSSYTDVAPLWEPFLNKRNLVIAEQLSGTMKGKEVLWARENLGLTKLFQKKRT